MELLLLDKDFELCGLISNFSSLLWNRKYYECGNFNLQIGLKYYEQFKRAKYLYSRNFLESGVFEGLNYKTTKMGTDIQISGRFLESLLAKRVINKTQNFTNMITEDIIRSLVSNFAIDVSDDRKIPELVLGNRYGLGRKRTIQITGANLLDKIYELCKEDELSIHLYIDFKNKKLVFEVWQGLDRTDVQNENSWAIFSKNFENLMEDSYSTTDSNYYNFAYVEGQGRNEERIGVEVNQIKEGEERREIYVDARDLQMGDDMTLDNYLELLKERGIEKLSSFKKVETSNFKINPLANLKYKTDYNLGDRTVYKNEDLNFSIDNRIVEITECYEKGEKIIDLTFGDDYDIKKLKEVIKN